MSSDEERPRKRSRRRPFTYTPRAKTKVYVEEEVHAELSSLLSRHDLSMQDQYDTARGAINALAEWLVLHSHEGTSRGLLCLNGRDHSFSANLAAALTMLRRESIRLHRADMLEEEAIMREVWGDD